MRLRNQVATAKFLQDFPLALLQLLLVDVPAALDGIADDFRLLLELLLTCSEGAQARILLYRSLFALPGASRDRSDGKDEDRECESGGGEADQLAIHEP